MTLVHHIAGRTLWLVLGGFVGALLWVHAGQASNALDGWLASGRQEVQTQAKYRWNIRVLAGQVAAHLHHEARLAQDTTRLRQTLTGAQAQAESLAHVADSLHETALSPAVRRIGEACGELAQNCEARVGAAMQALETEHAKANMALARAARGDSLLAAGLKASDCRFLLFHCPSRTQVAEGSFLTGVIMTLLVHH